MAAQDVLTPQVSYPTILPYRPPVLLPSSGMATQDTLAPHPQVSYPTIPAPPAPAQEPHYLVPVVMDDVADDFQQKPGVTKCFGSSNFAHLFHHSEETFYCDECENEYEEPVELLEHFFNTHDVCFVPCTHCNIKIP